MVDNSFGGSFLEDSLEGLSKKRDFKLISTPINHHLENDNDVLSPFEISGLMKDASTPLTTLNSGGDRLPSILKNSDTVNRSHKDEDMIPQSLLNKHPELNIASKNGSLNAVKCARVIFSPTKEIATYRNDYLLSEDELDTTHLQQRKLMNQTSQDNEPFELANTNENSTTPKQTSNNIQKDLFFTQILTEPTIPYVLSLYLQLFINICLIGVVFFFAYVFIKTIRADINHKLEKYTSDALQEISLCSREYYRNKCSIENGEQRVPALERACTTWSKCMNRDPQQLGKSKITAETLADIVNGFIKPISWKSLIFIMILIVGSILITNVAFGSYRKSSRLSSKEQKELKALREKVDEQSKSLQQLELTNETSFKTAYNERTPDYPRLQSPRGCTEEMNIRPGNTRSYNPANDSYASPLLNRKSSLKQQ